MKDDALSHGRPTAIEGKQAPHHTGFLSAKPPAILCSTPPRARARLPGAFHGIEVSVASPIHLELVMHAPQRAGVSGKAGGDLASRRKDSGSSDEAEGKEDVHEVSVVSSTGDPPGRTPPRTPPLAPLTSATDQLNPLYTSKKVHSPDSPSSGSSTAKSDDASDPGEVVVGMVAPQAATEVAKPTYLRTLARAGVVILDAATTSAKLGLYLFPVAVSAVNATEKSQGNLGPWLHSRYNEDFVNKGFPDVWLCIILFFSYLVAAKRGCKKEIRFVAHQVISMLTAFGLARSSLDFICHAIARQPESPDGVPSKFSVYGTWILGPLLALVFLMGFDARGEFLPESRIDLRKRLWLVGAKLKRLLCGSQSGANPQAASSSRLYEAWTTLPEGVRKGMMGGGVGLLMALLFVAAATYYAIETKPLTYVSILIPVALLFCTLGAYVTHHRAPEAEELAERLTHAGKVSAKDMAVVTVLAKIVSGVLYATNFAGPVRVPAAWATLGAGLMGGSIDLLRPRFPSVNNAYTATKFALFDVVAANSYLPAVFGIILVNVLGVTALKNLVFASPAHTFLLQALFLIPLLPYLLIRAKEVLRLQRESAPSPDSEGASELSRTAGLFTRDRDASHEVYIDVTSQSASHHPSLSLHHSG